MPEGTVDEAAPSGPAPAGRRSATPLDDGRVPALGGRLGITPRTLQVALGVLWILDAALQFQPEMFSKATVTTMILPMAHGQPAPLAWSITTLGHFLAPDIGVWNFLFATLQLAVGVGLLFRRTVRPALVVMFAWCLGVWWFGEGFGQLLTGQASPLTGAPGAVLVYAAIGLLAWPRGRSAAADDGAVGVASSAGARGPLGAWGALGAWSGLWVLAAVLLVLPAHRGRNGLHDAIAGAAGGQPGWYAHFLTTFAGHFSNLGGPGAWLLALAALVIGIGPVLSSRPTAFVVAGMVLSLAFWVTGQGLGGILTGMGTDPGTGPLVFLLGMAVLPAAVPLRASVRAPIGQLVGRNPTATWGVTAGVGAALLLSATYPVAGALSTAPAGAAPTVEAAGSTGPAPGASSMPGMAMGGSSSSPSSHSTGGLSMEGMGGTGAVQPDWHYTGPALPATEVDLLTNVTSRTDQGHAMQTPNCTTTPTATQVLGAMRYIQQTSAAVAPYKSLSAAVAAGYTPITDPRYPVVHYVKASYLQPADVMDPNHVQSLVYAFTPYGPVLVAAMYLMPSAGDDGPMPYGCLVQWHAHTNLCMSTTTGRYIGFSPCAAGTFNVRTPVMTHVWQVPVAGGPLALDPSDLQVVQAAIEAQRSGQAPMTDPSGNATSGSTGAFGITAAATS